MACTQLPKTGHVSHTRACLTSVCTLMQSCVRNFFEGVRDDIPNSAGILGETVRRRAMSRLAQVLRAGEAHRQSVRTDTLTIENVDEILFSNDIDLYD